VAGILDLNSYVREDMDGRDKPGHGVKNFRHHSAQVRNPAITSLRSGVKKLR
jgi:hypothetical protein